MSQLTPNLQHQPSRSTTRWSARVVLTGLFSMACLQAAISPQASPFANLVMSSAWADDDDDDSGGSSSGGLGGAGGGTGGAVSGSDGNSGNNTAQRRQVPLFTFLPWGTDQAERNELLAKGLTAAQRQALTQLNYRIKQERNSNLLSPQVYRITPPPGMNLATAITRVRQLAPQALADYNHYYTTNNGSRCEGASCAAASLIGWTASPGCSSAKANMPSIGMIDTGVDSNHPALAGQQLTRLSTRSSERSASQTAHGTAVASLLMGRSDGPAPGLLPRARLLAVDAFHASPRGDDRMDAFDLAAALDLLVQRGVKVINLSFAGPSNALIEEAVKKAQQRGVILVAAMGNGGPTAAPQYPAAYPGVIAVTAVQSDMNVYRRASRGEHLALAAPGVDLTVADAKTGGVVRMSGTSYAAPFVTAAAALLQSNGSAYRNGAAVREAMIRSSRDLGQTGFDEMYGHGLLQMNGLCKPAQRVAPMASTKPNPAIALVSSR